MRIPLDFTLTSGEGRSVVHREVRIERTSRWERCIVCQADIPRRLFVVAWDSGVRQSVKVVLHLRCAKGRGRLGEIVRAKIDSLSGDRKTRPLYRALVRQVVFEMSD